MTSGDAAWRQAKALHDAPESLFALRAAPLPEGMTALIRLASGAGAEAAVAADYLKRVCLYAGSPPWRCLGLAAGADPVLAKAHHRLLIKWLHPDRNPESQALAERVNAAWRALKGGGLPVPVPRHAPPPLRARSRFPLFLLALLMAASALLALSLWPDAAVYPEMAEPPEPVSAAASEPLPAMPAWPLPARAEHQPRAAAKAKSVTAAPVSPATVPVVEAPPPEPASVPAIADPPALPAATAAAMPVAEPSPVSSPSRAQGDALLHAFAQRYRAGDLAAFMALFSVEASNGRGGVADIRRDYRRLFQRTRSREIAFSQARWRAGEETLSVRLRYRAELGYGGMRAPAVQQGGLELSLALEDGNPRIVHYLLLE